MMDIALAAEQALADRLSSRLAKISQKNEISYDIAIVAGLVAVVGLGFLVYAAHIWLRNHYQADAAAALTGLMALGIACLLALFALIIMHYRQKTLRKLKHEIQDSLHDVIEFLNEISANPVRQSPKTAALVASLAGFIIGGKTL